MTKIRESGDSIEFFCPGCIAFHSVRIKHPTKSYNWTYNNDPNNPTLSPSIKVTGNKPLSDEEYDQVMSGKKVDLIPTVCHSFITDGKIQFLSDSTHFLSGTTVDLPDISNR